MCRYSPKRLESAYEGRRNDWLDRTVRVGRWQTSSVAMAMRFFALLMTISIFLRLILSLLRLRD